MAYKILSGPMMNLVGRGAGYGASALGPSISAATDTSFPLSNLYNGRPSVPMKLSAASTGFYMEFPNNLVRNGDFEQSSLTGWSSVSSTITSETGAGNFHKGARSLKIVTSAVFGRAQSGRITLQAGQYYQIWGAAKSDGTNLAFMQLNCWDINKSLNSSGAWDTIYTSCFTKTGNTMTAFTPIIFRAPTYSEVGKSTVEVQIYIGGAANGQTVYWDEVLITSGFDFVGCFGHNFRSTGLVLVEDTGPNYWHSISSAGGGFDTFVAAKEQSFYCSRTSRAYLPFPRIVWVPTGTWASGDMGSAPYIGEVVVGQMKTLDPCPDYPVAIEYLYPQSRMETARGDQWVMNRTRHPRRKVTMSFAYFNDAEYKTARDEIYNMSDGGAYPLVLVPEDTDSGVAIYGRVQPGVTFIRNNYITRTAEFVVQEEPFPVMA